MNLDLNSSHSRASETMDVSPDPVDIAKLESVIHLENIFVYFLTNGVKSIIVEKARGKALKKPHPHH